MCTADGHGDGIVGQRSAGPDRFDVDRRTFQIRGGEALIGLDPVAALADRSSIALRDFVLGPKPQIAFGGTVGVGELYTRWIDPTRKLQRYGHEASALIGCRRARAAALVLK